MRQTTEIQTVSHGRVSFFTLSMSLLTVMDAVITENGVRLRLNIVDTPGYGDQINNENWQVASVYFSEARANVDVAIVAGTQS